MGFAHTCVYFFEYLLKVNEIKTNKPAFKQKYKRGSNQHQEPLVTLSPLIKVHGCSDCSPHWNSLSPTVVAADNDQTDISRQIGLRLGLRMDFLLCPILRPNILGHILFK